MNYLKKGGHIIILAPAHNFLFNPFDKAIGHFRRYNRSIMNPIIPVDVKPVKHKYLDSVGLMASLANKILLKQIYSTKKQIINADKCLLLLGGICFSAAILGRQPYLLCLGAFVILFFYNFKMQKKTLLTS